MGSPRLRSQYEDGLEPIKTDQRPWNDGPNGQGQHYDEGMQAYEATRQDGGMQVIPADYPGIQVVPVENNLHILEPQVAMGTEGKEAMGVEEKGNVDTLSSTSGGVGNHSRSNPQPQWRSRKFWWILALLIIVIIIVVPVAVVEATRNKHSKSPARSSSTAPHVQNPQTNHTLSELSTTGAFNGTGLATLNPNNGADQLYLIFQHYSGEIRYSHLTDSNVWLNGIATPLVSSNVKNGTLIAATSYNPNGTANDNTTIVVFYLDRSRTVREVYQNVSAGPWLAGNVIDLGFQASDSSTAAFSCCWDPTWYGSDPGASSGGNSSGLRVYVGGADGLVQELVWYAQTDTWQLGYKFPNSNGNAGAGCMPVGDESYVYLQNTAGQLELWWKDYNISAPNSTAHPRGTWVQGPALATALRPNSSITASNYVYFQDPSDNIMGIPMNGSAETAYWGAPFTVGNEQAMPGTNIGVQFALDSSPSAHVFFQLNGSDVSEFSTSNTAGTWTMTEMPVD